MGVFVAGTHEALRGRSPELASLDRVLATARSAPEVVLAEVYRHHRQQLNLALRRPGMYGRDEAGLRLLVEALAVVDNRLADWTAEYDDLRSRGAFIATGVAGAFGAVVPAQVLQTAAAAVYAQIAHRLGWLEGAATCTAPAAVITSRGWAWPLRTTRLRPRSSRSAANSARWRRPRLPAQRHGP